MFSFKVIQIRRRNVMKSKKAVISTGKTKIGKRGFTKAMENIVTPEERQCMIAEAVCFCAEHRGIQTLAWSRIGLSLKLKLITY